MPVLFLAEGDTRELDTISLAPTAAISSCPIVTAAAANAGGFSDDGDDPFAVAIVLIDAGVMVVVGDSLAMALNRDAEETLRSVWDTATTVAVAAKVGTALLLADINAALGNIAWLLGTAATGTVFGDGTSKKEFLLLDRPNPSVDLRRSLILLKSSAANEVEVDVDVEVDVGVETSWSSRELDPNPDADAGLNLEFRLSETDPRDRVTVAA